MDERGNLEKARWAYLEANALNPYHPAVHEKLAGVFNKLKDEKRAREEREIFGKLQK